MSDAVFQTIEKLSSEASTTLSLSFGPKSIRPGEKVPKAEARETPALAWTPTTPKPDQKYILLSLDLDAPFPSFPFLSPILHFLASGIAIDPSHNALTFPDASALDAICPWGPPGPPPISTPHRYIFLLYEEPKHWDVMREEWFKPKGYGLSDRVKWDLGLFKKNGRIGDAVAATWFCSN